MRCLRPPGNQGIINIFRKGVELLAALLKLEHDVLVQTGSWYLFVRSVVLEIIVDHIGLVDIRNPLKMENSIEDL